MEDRLRHGLENSATSALVSPLTQLWGLHAAASADQRDIAAFGDSRKVSELLKASNEFWKNKMEEVIRSYTNHKVNYIYVDNNIITVSELP